MSEVVFHRHLIVLVHGIGRHGADKMEPRRSEMQEMVDSIMAGGTYVTGNTEIIVDYIDWHDDLHRLHGLDDAVELVNIKGSSQAGLED